jgi:hypothetical protein
MSSIKFLTRSRIIRPILSLRSTLVGQELPWEVARSDKRNVHKKKTLLLIILHYSYEYCAPERGNRPRQTVCKGGRVARPWMVVHAQSSTTDGSGVRVRRINRYTMECGADTVCFVKVFTTVMQPRLYWSFHLLYGLPFLPLLFLVY